MSWVQVLTPNPNVSCTPGWCLKYVSDAFGVSDIPHTNYASATDAWNASKQHQDQNFPDQWVPVWFSLANVPEGHVALRAPDGSVYSSSDPNTNVPHHHPSLAALINYYANANPLTYLGWSEDIGGTAVITNGEEMTQLDEEGVRILAATVLERPEPITTTPDLQNHIGGDVLAKLKEFFYSPEGKAADAWRQAVRGQLTAAQQTIADQGAQIAALQQKLGSQQTVDPTLNQQLTQAQADLATEKAKSAGLAKNLNDSQLELKDAKDQLAQAESIAQDDDAKIKDLNGQLLTAQAVIEQLKQADKPPAQDSQQTQTPASAPTQSTSTALSGALAWLVSFLRGKK